MRHLVTGCLTLSLFALVIVPGQAEAQCGYAPASWNAPNGAVVFNRGPGPIRDVLDAVGEYRTHSMLSHGPGGGVTHATMRTPDQNGWPTVCTLPLNATQLRYGYPGVESINQGGIYNFLFGESGSTEWTGYQVGDSAKAATVGDTIWYNYPYVTDAAQGDGSQVIRRPLRNGARVNYSLYQYRTLETANLIPSNSVNNGLVCSTFLAYAHNYSGQGAVSAYSYSHSQLYNASNSLYNGTYNACKSALGWFQGALLTVACPFYNVCGNAGNQVANCMSANRCDTGSSSVWKGVRDDPSTVATSISPDRIGGWGVHPINTTFWAPDYSHSLYFNSGGNVYGCWY